MLTVSHYSQEVPLAFKKYTKKRSWVWDWIEQDTENKFRAVCIYCQKEIFRLDGDRGSPKKLITHVNSKHGINKENYLNKEMTQLRILKLKEYIDTLGPLTTNYDDAIQLGVVKTDMLVRLEERPRVSKASSHRHLELDLNDNEESLKVKFLDSSKFLDETKLAAAAAAKLTESPQLEESTIEVDPSLQEFNLERNDIENYNYLVRMHNFQIEQYNKTMITSSPRSQMKPFKLLEIDSITEEQAYLKAFIEENLHCFNNLTFLESESFKKLLLSDN